MMLPLMKAAQLLNIDHRTLRRRMQILGIMPGTSHDGRQKVITPAQLGELQHFGGEQQSVYDDDLRRRVEVLEREVRALRSLLIPVEVSTVRAVPALAQGALFGLPEGWEPAIEYLIGMGMSETTARRRLKQLPHHVGSWGGVRYAFDPDQLAIIGKH